MRDNVEHIPWVRKSSGRHLVSGRRIANAGLGWGVLLGLTVSVGVGFAAPPRMAVQAAPDQMSYLITENGQPVLRYNFGTVPVPEGVPAKYARGDYISPLYGPGGVVLTEDYPKDHLHHRGVWWSWPVTRWNNEVRDLWAVVGVWSRPVAIRRMEGGDSRAVLEAENVWKWDDKEAIVKEEVLICAFKAEPTGRFIDIEVRLTALVDGVAIGGSPHGGYGGFALRAAPTKEQQIVRHVDPPEATPRRSWLDYSGVFPGATEVVGVAIFEHPTNPGYPSELQAYPHLNCVMPAFPGEREVPIPKGQTLTLKHRLWVHPGRADEKSLAEVWRAYADSPQNASNK